MSKQKKNILFAVPSINNGGVEVGILEIAKQNNIYKGFNMFVLTSGGSMTIRLESLGVKVINLDIKSKSIFKVISNIWKIKKILIDNKIDLVSAESRVPAWSCYFACKKANVKFATTVHGAYNNKMGIFSWLKRFYNSSMVRGNNIVCVSQYIKNYVTQNFPKFINKQNKNIAVIYRGIDLNIFSPEKVSQSRLLILQNNLNLPEDKIIIALPARFTKIKGHFYFLKVLQQLKKTRDDFCCVMVGDMKKHPEFIEKLQKEISHEGLDGFVKIHDNINDMPALYTLSNIIVSTTTTSESFGRISVEAQAMGKIFIGTALGGTLETVKDRISGFLAPANNVEKFALILNNVMNLPQYRKDEIIVRAKENGKWYSLENMYKQTLDFYQKIISEK